MIARVVITTCSQMTLLLQCKKNPKISLNCANSQLFVINMNSLHCNLHINNSSDLFWFLSAVWLTDVINVSAVYREKSCSLCLQLLTLKYCINSKWEHREVCLFTIFTHWHQSGSQHLHPRPCEERQCQLSTVCVYAHSTSQRWFLMMHLFNSNIALNISQYFSHVKKTVL